MDNPGHDNADPKPVSSLNGARKKRRSPRINPPMPSKQPRSVRPQQQQEEEEPQQPQQQPQSSVRLPGSVPVTPNQPEPRPQSPKMDSPPFSPFTMKGNYSPLPMPVLRWPAEEETRIQQPVTENRPKTMNVIIPHREIGLDKFTWWLVDLLHEPPVEQGATPVVANCLRQYADWDETLARRVLNGYRQFLELATEAEDWRSQMLIPPPLIDQLWMVHIQDLAVYCHDCMILCGQVLSRNVTSSNEAERRLLTLHRLKSKFGNKYDPEIWSYGEGVAKMPPATTKPAATEKRAASSSKSEPTKPRKIGWKPPQAAELSKQTPHTAEKTESEDDEASEESTQTSRSAVDDAESVQKMPLVKPGAGKETVVKQTKDSKDEAGTKEQSRVDTKNISLLGMKETANSPPKRKSETTSNTENRDSTSKSDRKGREKSENYSGIADMTQQMTPSHIQSERNAQDDNSVLSDLDAQTTTSYLEDGNDKQQGMTTPEPDQQPASHKTTGTPKYSITVSGLNRKGAKVGTRQSIEVNEPLGVLFDKIPYRKLGIDRNDAQFYVVDRSSKRRRIRSNEYAKDVGLANDGEIELVVQASQAPKKPTRDVLPAKVEPPPSAPAGVKDKRLSKGIATDSRAVEQIAGPSPPVVVKAKEGSSKGTTDVPKKQADEPQLLRPGAIGVKDEKTKKKSGDERKRPAAKQELAPPAPVQEMEEGMTTRLGSKRKTLESKQEPTKPPTAPENAKVAETIKKEGSKPKTPMELKALNMHHPMYPFGTAQGVISRGKNLHQANMGKGRRFSVRYQAKIRKKNLRRAHRNTK